MIISDISVRRPVFATVLSLLLVILGVMAFDLLPVRELPDIDPPIVSIDTSYRGASAEVVETKITQVIEDRVAGLAGIKKLTSTSRDERSSISIEFDLDRDVDAAANDVRDRISRVLGNLPDEADPPEVAKVEADTDPVMWLNLTSSRLNTLELTDFAERVLVDRLSTANGVARVRISGERRYAMRIWLDREALAARGLTVTEVENALRAENVELPAGRLESQQREFTLRTRTAYEDPADFEQLVIGRGPNGLVRLNEVARVEKAAADERNLARANGVPAISLGIEQQSKANTIQVSDGVRAQLAAIAPTLPEGMQLNINFDRAVFIKESIREVYKALGISLALVLIVIYAFLGTLRATLIPGVVVPISMLSAVMVMAAMGYSLNTLTLLGLVLAIGLVVDDAIVVLENIYRRIEEGEQPLLAALDGSREIAFAVIATTLVLAAVFLPISYIQGNIGRLFGEFGITVAAAVLFSGLIALTLTPMMASKMFTGPSPRAGFAHRVDTLFRSFASRYAIVLRGIIARPLRMVGLIVGVTVLAALLFKLLPKEYSPEEDRGVVFAVLQGPEGASLNYMLDYAARMEAEVLPMVERGDVERALVRVPGGFGGAGVNSARTLLLLSDWHSGRPPAKDLANELRSKLGPLPGVQARVNTPRGLGVRGGDRPVVVVLGGGDYTEINKAANQLKEWMESTGRFQGVDTDYFERKPTMEVRVDRNRAADLGVSLAAIGRTLETMLGSRVVTRYVDQGEEYDVILQAEPADRATPTDLGNLYVRSSTTGNLVPLNNLVTLIEEAGPTELRRFDRLRSITVVAAPVPGYALGTALDDIETYANAQLPDDIQVRWDGESREFRDSGSSLYFTFVLALVIVFLVLAAQFESFVHPFVILTTVPLAVTGALIGLWVYGFSINVYTQIGAILLVGLAAKNGVLIVEFTNQLRDRGMAFMDAVVEASSIRLRPVLMTSLTAVFGAFPLMFASGAGAEGRQAVGVVVVFGVVFATLMTLFVVPAMYALLARNTGSPEDVAKRIEALRPGGAASH
jgi:multidrug efflux pump